MVNNGIVVMTMTVTQTEYENPWVYKNTTFTSDDIGDFFGFVYRITNLQSGKNTSEENTSINSESLEVSLGKLSLKVTGKNTMGVVMNLIPIERLLETNVSNEK